ncbi:MAG: sulfite exporter TauE/SafE family protein [Spirochaetia bacterium]|nr:sulfite exporter TauE/SafE family protein [Spirochaetia bacterium]
MNNIETINLIYLALLFFLIALIYSSAGFGGGSSYLAILALFSFPFYWIPKIALICNIIVVTGGFIIFYRQGFFSFKRVLPFATSSIPFAYLGGSIIVSKNIFLIILSISLILVSMRLLFMNEKNQQTLKNNFSLALSVVTGSVIGFFSGMIGIGGGIFLSPFLFLMNWGHAKEIAATSSFFILVNSVSGLSGQIIKHELTKDFLNMGFKLLPLPAAVFLGGQAGSRLGAYKLKPEKIRIVTGIIILIVALRLIVKIIEEGIL